MSEASHHDRRILLEADALESAAVAAGYIEGMHLYARLKNRALMEYNLRCAFMCIRSAAHSWKDLKALDAPREHREEAE